MVWLRITHYEFTTADNIDSVSCNRNQSHIYCNRLKILPTYYTQGDNN